MSIYCGKYDLFSCLNAESCGSGAGGPVCWVLIDVNIGWRWMVSGSVQCEPDLIIHSLFSCIMGFFYLAHVHHNVGMLWIMICFHLRMPSHAHASHTIDAGCLDCSGSPAGRLHGAVPHSVNRGCWQGFTTSNSHAEYGNLWGEDVLVLRQSPPWPSHSHKMKQGLAGYSCHRKSERSSLVGLYPNDNTPPQHSHGFSSISHYFSKYK